MVVELISVGTELLLGNIVNTNASYLAEHCAALGLSLYYQTVVGDNKERLAETVKLAFSRSDVVILTGGLGPTKDDLTKEVVAEVFGRKLEEDSHTKKRIKEYFKDGWVVTDNNWKQALIPKGATVIDNHNGTAPGIILEEGKRSLILMPGPPNEMIPMFQISISPYLNQMQPEIISSQMVKICGMGESVVETKISDIIDAQTNPTIAPYAKTGEVHLRITAKAKDDNEAKKLMKPIMKELKLRFGRNIFTTEADESLEEAVIKLLRKNELTLTTAESCTGGMLSSRLINVAGASDVFKEGFVTYSNKAKRKTLGVSKATLKKYGAVSEKTAKEMAKGGVFEADSDVCVAITGVAGPDCSESKPVGLVYIACYIKNEVTVKEFKLKGNREKIREYSVVNALTLLRDCILDNYK